MLDLKTLILQLKIRLYSPHAIKYYQQLLKNQYLSSNELYKLNWEKRKKVGSWKERAVAVAPGMREKFSIERCASQYLETYEAAPRKFVR